MCVCVCVDSRVVTRLGIMWMHPRSEEQRIGRVLLTQPLGVTTRTHTRAGHDHSGHVGCHGPLNHLIQILWCARLQAYARVCQTRPALALRVSGSCVRDLACALLSWTRPLTLWKASLVRLMPMSTNGSGARIMARETSSPWVGALRCLVPAGCCVDAAAASIVSCLARWCLRGEATGTGRLRLQLGTSAGCSCAQRSVCAACLGAKQ